MTKLALEHFDKQKLENGSYPEKLFYMEMTELEDGSINLELKSFNVSDDVPDYEFVDHKTKLPVVKTLNV